MANKTFILTYNKGEKNEFTLQVHGYYTPPEKEIRYPVDRAQPGSAADLDIDKVELISGSLTDLLYEGVTIDDICEKILGTTDIDDDWSDDWDDFDFDDDDD